MDSLYLPGLRSSARQGGEDLAGETREGLLEQESLGKGWPGWHIWSQ